MKKFKDLSVGGIIYSVDKTKSLLVEKDYYGNIIKENTICETKCSSLELTKDGEVGVNVRYNNYTNKYDSDMLIKKDELELSVIERTNKIYFVNIKDAEKVLRQMALDKLKSLEKSIETYKQNRLKDMEEIRKNYYYVLNEL